MTVKIVPAPKINDWFVCGENIFLSQSFWKGGKPVEKCANGKVCKVENKCNATVYKPQTYNYLQTHI